MSGAPPCHSLVYPNVIVAFCSAPLSSSCAFHSTLVAPYVVGSNPNSPANPHSAMASGGNDIDHIDTSPPQEAYVLYGGVVGGPDQKDRFYDIRSDWPETEVRTRVGL